MIRLLKWAGYFDDSTTLTISLISASLAVTFL
jgi:hypothetical protein